jgi:membrane protein DedA with SNARE-associated domain
MTTLGSLIETYGYWLLAADSLLAGETIPVLAGFSVRRGHLFLLAVLGIAAVASFIGYQFYFWLGRRHGPAVFVRWPSVAESSAWINGLIADYPATVIIGVRFVYGLRIAGPVLIGMSPISASRFSWLNALGAVLWACLLVGIGWVFGRAAELGLEKIEQYEIWLLLGLAAGALIAWATRRKRAH